MRAITNKIHTQRVCSNRAATRANIVKAREKLPRPNASICSNFASYRNLQKTIAPPSHGGGHEFESRQVHSFFDDLQVKRGRRSGVDYCNRTLFLASTTWGSWNRKCTVSNGATSLLWV